MCAVCLNEGNSEGNNCCIPGSRLFIPVPLAYNTFAIYLLFADYKAAHVASVLKSLWALSSLRLSNAALGA